MLISEDVQRTLAEKIAKQEEATDGELVTVLSARADNYHFFSFSLAAILSFLLAAGLSYSPLWLTVNEVLLVQLVVWLLLVIGFRWSPLLRLIVPKQVQRQRAFNMARQQFVENQLHHTINETGVLIFVSELEHYVEILVDRGVSQKVSNAAWQQIVDNFVSRLKAQQMEQGFREAIGAVGELLASELPSTHTKNELPNHLVAID